MRADVRIDKNGDLGLGRSIVRFGLVAREDPDAEIHIYRLWPNGHNERVVREFVGGVKSKKYDLPAGHQFVVIVIGDKHAGVPSTSPEKLVSPFNVFMNPPEDHSKDFLRIDVPTNVPVEGDLKRSILKALKEK